MFDKCCSACCGFLLLLGRVFIALIFIMAGMHKIFAFHDTLASMVGVGMPMSEVLLILAIVFELGGGLLLALGLYTRFAAVLLLIFVAMVTYFFHSFWEYQGAEYVNNMQHFLKNLCISGGLLYVLAVGGGSLSFDRCISKCCKRKTSE